MPKQFDKAPYTKPALPEVITTDGIFTYGSL